MLIRRVDLDRIVAGEVTLAFRRWRRPTVKAGGTLRTAVGMLRIDAVEEVRDASITNADARAAGFASRDAVLKALATHVEGRLFRIRLCLAGVADPRDALRHETQLSSEALADLRGRLAKMDSASPHGPWTEAKIKATLDSKKSVQANFVKPLPVYIVYFSAAALNDGRIVDYRDIYGRDGKAIAALNMKDGGAVLAKPKPKPAVVASR